MARFLVTADLVTRAQNREGMIQTQATEVLAQTLPGLFARIEVRTDLGDRRAYASTISGLCSFPTIVSLLGRYGVP